VAPVLSGGELGTPFNAAASGGTGLNSDGKQYAFNWDTKSVAVGTYQIILTLSDGSVQTKTLQIVTKGGYNGLLVDGTAAMTPGIGGLLAGDIELYIDNSSDLFTSDELIRLNDAVAAVDAIIADYGVSITEVADGGSANMVLDTGSTSAVGGYADGVLGCTGDGEITLTQGWNWYAGGDAAAIGADQYDFETVVIHELGHTLGLGHNPDSTSVMYATLSTGVTKRSFTIADLNIPDVPDSADSLRAALPASSQFEGATGATGLSSRHLASGSMGLTLSHSPTVHAGVIITNGWTRSVLIPPSIATAESFPKPPNPWTGADSELTENLTPADVTTRFEPSVVMPPEDQDGFLLPLNCSASFDRTSAQPGAPRSGGSSDRVDVHGAAIQEWTCADASTERCPDAAVPTLRSRITPSPELLEAQPSEPWLKDLLFAALCITPVLHSFDQKERYERKNTIV
jgi:hypothetical protein